MTSRLHLGCGSRYLPGYIHVDITAHPHVDVVTDVTQSMDSYFQPGSIDEIYACHILEHIGRRSVEETLKSWLRLLRPGGVLRLAVPDFQAIVAEYVSNPLCLHDTLLGLIYGGQRNQWDYHTMGFDFPNLSRLLERIGFVSIQRYDWSTFLPDGYDDYSRCYLPHFDPTGRLMSLNIVAIAPADVRT